MNKSEAAGEFSFLDQITDKSTQNESGLVVTARQKKVINSTLVYASAKWAKLQAAEIKYVFSPRGVVV